MPVITRLILPKAPQGANLPRHRTSPRERGYTSRWDKFSRLYRISHPFCAECLRLGRTVFGELVDHKYPVQDGGPMLPGLQGVWTLCTSHHGWKAALEQHARETGQMDLIVRWCDEPEIRPPGF